VAGQYRELESVLEGAARLAKTDFIDVACLPKNLRDLQAAETPGPFIPTNTWPRWPTWKRNTLPTF